MNKAISIGAVVALLALPIPALAEPIQSTLYKNPHCSCCEGYADYLLQNGFEVDVKETVLQARTAYFDTFDDFGFFTDSFAELKKVRWPSRKELTSYTLVVLITIIAVTVYFWVLDIGISALVELIV